MLKSIKEIQDDVPLKELLEADHYKLVWQAIGIFCPLIELYRWGVYVDKSVRCTPDAVCINAALNVHLMYNTYRRLDDGGTYEVATKYSWLIPAALKILRLFKLKTTNDIPNIVQDCLHYIPSEVEFKEFSEAAAEYQNSNVI